MRRVTWMVLALAATVAVDAVEAKKARSRRSERIEQALDVTDSAPASATGTARLVLRGPSDGKFDIAATGLAPRMAHDVILHGIKIGALSTDRHGKGRILYRSRARGRVKGLGFEPRGLPLEVRNSSGNVVLTGTLPDLDPNLAACCIDGTSCEERTPDDCAAAGGTVPDTRSCLPNPCDDQPAITTFVCCLPCGDPPPCEQRTEEACLADDGFIVEGDTCDPNPRAPAAPAQIQCCLADGDQGFFSICQVRTPDDCANDGGIDMGDGSCDPNPCEQP